jgi:hypothetical protein
MNLNLYTFIGGLTAAAVGGWRYWLTRGRPADRKPEVSDRKPEVSHSSAGTDVPEGTAKAADGKKET